MTGKKISLLIYDFDGTLVDTIDDITDAVNLARNELNFPALPRESIAGNVGGGVANLMSRSLEATGYRDLDQAVRLFLKHYRKNLLNHSRFYPHCRETLEYFSDKKQAICSNKLLDLIETILEGLDGLRHFQMIVGGDSFDAKKPDPKGVHSILSNLKIPPSEAIFVGDSAVDIDTGKRAGIHTCAVTYGLGDPAALQAAQPDWTIGNFADLLKIVE